MTSSFFEITIADETHINNGNSGTDVQINQAQSWKMDFATPSGYYLAAPAEEKISWRHSFVFYVSGTICEAGDIVTLTPNGDVPAEYNGNALAADAVIITPEIFFSKYADSGDGTEDPGPIAQPPRAADGKVTTPTNVVLLYHADMNVPEWRDSSGFTRPVVETGLPELDQIRKSFGPGSLLLPDNNLNNGLLAPLSQSEGRNFQDFSFTWESRLRFDSVEPKEHILLSYGLGDNTLLEITARFYLNEEGEPKQSIKVDWTTAIDEDPLVAPTIDGVEIELADGTWKAKPEQLQQTSIVYAKSTGEFGIHVDGIQAGYLNASERVEPLWGSIFLYDWEEECDAEGVCPSPDRIIATGCTCLNGIADLNIQRERAFVGRMDEIRWTLGEALYDPAYPTAQVYAFAWPSPIVDILNTVDFVPPLPSPDTPTGPDGPTDPGEENETP